jgi:hypothetical protein
MDHFCIFFNAQSKQSPNTFAQSVHPVGDFTVDVLAVGNSAFDKKIRSTQFLMSVTAYIHVQVKFLSGLNNILNCGSGIDKSKLS